MGPPQRLREDRRLRYRVARKAVKTKSEKRKMARLMDAERVAMQMVDEKLRKQAPREVDPLAAGDDDDQETPTEFVRLRWAAAVVCRVTQ